MRRFNHIELFAGAGGLSLGLETAGFELLLANELSPMASETFAFNHLNVDLDQGLQSDDKVFWISSEHPRSELKKRLRENPLTGSGLQKHHYSDLLTIQPSEEQLTRSLLIGSIKDLNDLLERDDCNLRKQIKSLGNDSDIDLISGGPPCQSFSLAGLRDHTNQRNRLPWEFARFVNILRPKIALLENVSGILRAFKIDGEQYYAWFEVAKAFAQINYVPICLHINAKYSGVAQNRPRFIMIALRKDICSAYMKNSSDKTFKSIAERSLSFTQNVIDPSSDNGELVYYDIDKEPEYFQSGLLSLLNQSGNKDLVSVRDAIMDLVDPKITESSYVSKVNYSLLNRFNKQTDKNLNHELRSNSNKVRARFRLYQILNRLTKDQKKAVQNHLKSGGNSELSEELVTALEAFWILTVDGKRVNKPSKKLIIELINSLYSKKQTQKALQADAPAPAALSIPDDACHFEEEERSLRTLTVREMARIQSFPDWYQIRSKVTTGGQMRKFEVPQYTQIGNAVPPLLALQLGQLCREILNTAEGSTHEKQN